MEYGENEIATSYKYKIQWLFKVAPDLFQTHKQELKSLFAVIRAFGANSFDKINIKNLEGKVIGTYSDNRIMLNHKKMNDKAVNYIKYQLKKNNNIHYVELIRK